MAPTAHHETVYAEVFDSETSLKKYRVHIGETDKLVSKAADLLKRAGLPVPQKLPDPMFHIYKAAVLRDTVIWNAVQKLSEYYEEAKIVHPATPKIKTELKQLLSKKGAIAAPIKKLIKSAKPAIPRCFVKRWCEELGMKDTTRTGIFLDPTTERPNVPVDFIAELTSLSHEFWTANEVNISHQTIYNPNCLFQRKKLI